MSARRLSITRDQFRLKVPFTISRGTVHSLELVTAHIEEDGRVGRGECRPYPRYGESMDSVEAEIEHQRRLIEQGAGREQIGNAMRAGAARNAVDNALWDLEAKRAGVPVHELAGLDPPGPHFTTYTLGLDTPEKMAEAAASARKPILKLKLGDPRDDLARVEAVREAAPASRLVIDANEGWEIADLERLLPDLHALDVEMIEQPLHATHDQPLAGLDSPIVLCADESCHTADDLPRLKALYGMVNIKLDKTGGLTGGIRLMKAAMEADMRFMIGCMMASSLAMAPAQLLASGADYVDLDAPLLLAEDRDPPIRFAGAMMHPAEPALWG